MSHFNYAADFNAFPGAFLRTQTNDIALLTGCDLLMEILRQQAGWGER